MREINIKVTWEQCMYEYLRILFNPHASLTDQGAKDMHDQMLHVARMADKWAAHVQQRGEE